MYWAANDSTPRLVRGGGSDEAGVVAPEDRSEAGSESVAACEEEFLDGTWQVVVLQAAEDKVPVEHLHLFGTRRGSNKCKGDLAAVLVYDHALDDTAVTRIALHLKAKYRIEPLDAEQRWADRIPRNLLMRPHGDDLSAGAPMVPPGHSEMARPLHQMLPGRRLHHRGTTATKLVQGGDRTPSYRHGGPEHSDTSVADRWKGGEGRRDASGLCGRTSDGRRTVRRRTLWSSGDT